MLYPKNFLRFFFDNCDKILSLNFKLKKTIRNIHSFQIKKYVFCYLLLDFGTKYFVFNRKITNNNNRPCQSYLL